MYRLFVLRNDSGGFGRAHALISLGALLLCSGIGALAQSAALPLNGETPFSIRAHHLLGLPNTKNDCKELYPSKTICCDFSKAASASQR